MTEQMSKVGQDENSKNKPKERVEIKKYHCKVYKECFLWAHQSTGQS